MIKRAIDKVVGGSHLSEAEMAEVMDVITSGRATPAQIGALLVGLRLKGETVEEITGAARVLRAKSAAIPLRRTGPEGEVVVDTCGTGGDGGKTFNVSTAAAFVAAGAGLKVAKHGNRAVSSRCGSADVLEALGVDLARTPEQVGACIDRIGIGFLYAPLFHGSMGHVAGPRREIGLRTIFNLLGPLTNPAGATVQVVGVFRPDLTETLAQVLLRLGCRSAFVVHGLDGYDEISLTGPTKVTRLAEGALSTFIVTPEDFGLRRARPEDIAGGDAAQNAAILRGILEGQAGARRDMVLLNAAAVLVAAGRAENLGQGIELAAEAVDSGSALAKLNLLVAVGLDSSSRCRFQAA